MSTTVCICINGRIEEKCPCYVRSDSGNYHLVQDAAETTEIEDWEKDSEVGDMDRYIVELKTKKPGQQLERNRTVPIEREQNRYPRSFNGRSIDSSQMEADNRVTMDRFKSLRIGDDTLQKLSIGGYQIDMIRTAEKAQEIVPLPPSKLPIIFQDEELNFYHHFFNGIRTVLGDESFESIISSTTYACKGENELVADLKKVMSEGFLPTDTELTVFIKGTLKSTFEYGNNEGIRRNIPGLVVATNLWGFQYIEPGMRLTDSGIKMWLSICYNNYRLLWFNSFKDTSVPAFALEGVTRFHSAPQGRLRDNQGINDECNGYEPSVSTSRPRSRKKRSSPRSSDAMVTYNSKSGGPRSFF
jgi:hypothetical protein